MSRVAPLRLAALTAGVLAAAAAAVGASPATPTAGPAASAQVRPVADTYPTNAAKIFRWGNAQFYDDFISPVKKMWSLNHPSLVRDQHGMLTINGTATSGTVSATLTGHGRSVGRWEARVRAQQYSTKATPYHVVWELIPTYTSTYHCGARSIVLADYALGSNTATMHVRNTPDVDYSASKVLALGPGPFHTYAVEVTADHISWFVDTHVIRTERRDSAHSDAKFKVRFRLVAPDGATMNPGRMQMDWVRYYTLERKNARSIEAPQMDLGTFADAC
jgi:beta-glucanase (GH16 family)